MKHKEAELNVEYYVMHKILCRNEHAKVHQLPPLSAPHFPFRFQTSKKEWIDYGYTEGTFIFLRLVSRLNVPRCRL